MMPLMVCLNPLGDHSTVKHQEVQKDMIALHALRKYIAPIIQAEEQVAYKSGQVLFYEGHKPYGVYVLKKGRVRLFKKNENAEKLLRIVLPGHILGADEMGESRAFEFGAKAETDVLVSFFSRSYLKTE